jgi:hexosaminidase
MTETQCIIPQLGSDPNSVGGWYSTDDYKAILKYAEERHVKVIPEFDMPGHAHAAIAAMLARYRAGNNDSYLLSDLDDASNYM